MAAASKPMGEVAHFPDQRSRSAGFDLSQLTIRHHMRFTCVGLLNARPPAIRTKQPPLPRLYRWYKLDGVIAGWSFITTSVRAGTRLGRLGHGSGPSNQSERLPSALTAPNDTISTSWGLILVTQISSSLSRKPSDTLTDVRPRQRAHSDKAKPAYAGIREPQSISSMCFFLPGHLPRLRPAFVIVASPFFSVPASLEITL